MWSFCLPKRQRSAVSLTCITVFAVNWHNDSHWRVHSYCITDTAHLFVIYNGSVDNYLPPRWRIVRWVLLNGQYQLLFVQCSTLSEINTAAHLWPHQQNLHLWPNIKLQKESWKEKKLVGVARVCNCVSLHKRNMGMVEACRKILKLRSLIVMLKA